MENPRSARPLRKAASLSAALLFCIGMMVARAQAETDLTDRTEPREPDVPEAAEVIVLDVLSRPGQEAEVWARVLQREKKSFRSAAGLALEFQIDGTSAALVQTDRDGFARAPVALKDEGDHLIGARLLANDLLQGPTGYAVFTVAASSRPILLVDLDGAVMRGFSDARRPAESAASVLNALSETYQLAYLTDREISEWTRLQRYWLQWKIPKAPVMLWNVTGRRQKRTDWRSRQISRWLKDWRTVPSAVGGSPEILRAFREQGIPAISGESWKEVQKRLGK